MHLERASGGGAITFRSSFPLTCGGEGCIYPLPQEPLLLAKIYHHPDLERGRKLALMVARPLEDPMAAQGHVSVAWPIDVLRDKDRRGQVVGFLMRRVSDMFPVVNFYNPSGRRQSCPLFNWYYLHQTARNLAAAFAAVHRRDSLVADVNGRNILVSQRALVTLVDTDSFQVRDPESGHTFRCPVGTPEYTPPELQGRELSEIDRNRQHDCFGLGVILFQLLMEGTHPFAGAYLGHGDPPPYEQRILVGHFPYGSKNSIPYRPMPVAPPLSILHPVLQHMFVRCFEDGYRDPSARPDAPSWQNALEEAAAAMVTCRVNEQHRYSRHLASCPWCERTRQLAGRDPFPSIQAVQKGLHLPPRPARPQPQPKHTRHYHYGSPHVHTFPSPLAPKPRRAQTHRNLGFYRLPDNINRLVQAGLTTGFWIACAVGADWRRKVLFGLIAACASAAQLLTKHRPRWPQHFGIDYTMLLLIVIAGVFTPMIIPVSFFALFLIGAVGLRLVNKSQWKTPFLAGYLLFAAIALLSSGLLSLGKEAAASPGQPAQGAADLANVDHANAAGLRQLYGHVNAVSAVAWSPDSKALATAGLDWTVILWEPESGQRVATLGAGGPLYSVAWSPNGDTLATGDGNGAIKLWDVESRKLRFQFRDSGTSAITSLVWSHDGKTLASASWDGTIRLWQAANGRVRSEVTGGGQLISLAWSPDGSMLASGSLDRTLGIWDVSNNKQIRAAGDASYVHDDSWVAWSPDGQVLAVSGIRPGIKLVKLRERGSLWVYETIDTSAKGPIAWSPDGKRLANGSDDSKVILWNVANKLPLRILSSYTERVDAIAWSPDGKTLAIAHGNKALLWQVDR
jgi:serine/threonine protein kinase